MDDIVPVFGIEPSADKALVIAGPCAAESEQQVLDTARALAAAGVRVFRAGVWKPRTKPGSFEGVGSEALKWLAKVKAETSMHTVTEVANEKHLIEAVNAGIDGIWLGARTTANPFAVQEIADAISALNAEQRDNLTVLVKNPINPDLELWIGAIERIVMAGVRQVGAIHRGFSTYGVHDYRNPPHWNIPIELHRRIPGIQLLCDPSHIGGCREYIGDISRMALEMNFDGLIIESHISPDMALSDSAQQIEPTTLAELMKDLRKPSSARSVEGLEALRRNIDCLDDELIDILSRRMAVAQDIGRYKHSHNLTVVQPDRYKNLIAKRVEEGTKRGLSSDFIRNILVAIHEESVRQQLETR